MWKDLNDGIALYVTGKKPGAPHVIHTGPMSVKVSDVAVTIDENLPLIKKETQITIDHVSQLSITDCAPLYSLHTFI